MEIDREINQGGLGVSISRIKFVLDEIEKLDLDLDTFFRMKMGNRLTYEEIIGALVSAEQSLKEIEGEKCSN